MRISHKPLLAGSRSRWFVLAAVSWISMFSESVGGQEQWRIEPEGLASPAQQLAMEQVSELVEAGQKIEALSQISRLNDDPHALVRAGPIQAAGTQRVQVFRTLQKWCRDQRESILTSDPELYALHKQQWNMQASVAYQSLQESKDAAQYSMALVRYHATDFGSQLAKLQTDILLESGQGVAALHVLEDKFFELSRVELSAVSGQLESVAVPWYRAWQAAKSNPTSSGRILELWKALVREHPTPWVEVLSRQLTAAAVNPEHLDLDAMLEWALLAAEHTQDPSHALAVNGVIESVRDWTKACNIEHPDDFNLSQWPDRQVQLERYSNSYDLTPSTRPPVGQLQAMLPFRPSIYDGKVFLHELTRIRAFELDQNTPWPSPQSAQPLFDSQTDPAAYLPLGYPTLGTPRGMVTINQGCLYARMGAPVTAWANRTRSNDGSSISYLIGLDLDSQGRLLQGFPRHLVGSEFDNAEFEGCPVVSGQLLISTVTQRDYGNVRRRLVAMDRYSGKMVWTSHVLGSGVVVGSQRANIISNSQPVVAAGLVYYASDLGTIACLDAKTGQTIWLTSYQPSGQHAADYPRANRFRFRDGNPCLVQHGLIYCLPQDCPELIALDALSGDMVWSTNEVEVADCIHMVGLSGRTVLVSGDRLVWLDSLTGRLLGQFPESTTPGIVNSLPQPRGLGRATLAGGKVYWPASGEVYVFQADLAGDQRPKSSFAGSPDWINRFTTGSRGAEGGNMVAVGKWLVMVTPGRLVCFRSD